MTSYTSPEQYPTDNTGLFLMATLSANGWADIFFMDGTSVVSSFRKYTANRTDLNFNTAAAPAKTGYSFGGWQTYARYRWSDTDFKYTYYTGGIWPANQQLQVTFSLYKFEAIWTADTYDVTFTVGTGATAVAASYLKATYNSSYTLPPASTRTGYSHTHWVLASGHSWAVGSKFDNYPWPYNMTFFPNWTGFTHTLTYNGNSNTGGSTGNTSAVYPNNITVATNSFERRGYDFAGWATSSGGAVAYANNAIYTHPATTGTTTLYAKWNIKKYTVIFNANGKGTGKDVTQDYNTSVSLPTLKAVGWVFGGWATNSTATTADVTAAFTMPVNGRTLHAVWTENANKTVSFSELKTVYGVTNQTISISEYQKYIQKPANTLTALSGDFKGKGPAPP